MELTKSEAAILTRFSEKTRLAGGAKAGYLLRLANLRRLEQEQAGLAIDDGLAALVDKGLLAPTEAGDRYYLTEQGAERVAALRPGA